MKLYHLGDLTRFNHHKNNDNAYRTVLHTHGDSRLFVAEFDNEDSCKQCTRLFGLIKNCAANINGAHQRGRICLEEKRHRFRTVWIPLTERYISEWGLHMVPLDIRRAIADIRSSISMSAVVWPAILYRDDDVGPDIIFPANVDEFGMLLED